MRRLTERDLAMLSFLRAEGRYIFRSKDRIHWTVSPNDRQGVCLEIIVIGHFFLGGIPSLKMG